jgi:threonine aldolase
MPETLIDLSSDSVTLPSAPMRRAMARAAVGEDERREDPTVRRLEEQVAELLGKEAGLFAPSGTLCNILVLYVTFGAGDEVLAEESAHIVSNEAGGAAVHSRVTIKTVRGTRGVFGPEAIERLTKPDRYGGTRLRGVCVENTHTRAGGTVWAYSALRAVRERARTAHLITHLDGSRLLNAAAASSQSPADLSDGFDSVWISLAKGLGCPAGAVLAGDGSLIDAARAARKLFGGAMCQPGVLAAAGIYALTHNVDRPNQDHALARHFATKVAAIPGINVDVEDVETNIVLFDVGNNRVPAKKLLAVLETNGVRFAPVEGNILRAVTHLGITKREIDHAVSTLQRTLVELRPLRSRRASGRPLNGASPKTDQLPSARGEVGEIPVL